MSALFAVLGGLHWIGVIAIASGYLPSVLRGRLSPLLLWGARAQLLIGLALAGAALAQGMVLNHLWLAGKLLVALGVVACTEMAARRGRASRFEADHAPHAHVVVPQGLLHGAGFLTLVNVYLGLVLG